MGIKNMPEFDDIDIGPSSSSSKNKNTSGIDVLGLLNHMGITEIDQFKPMLKMLGIDDATINEMLASYGSLEDLVNDMNSLDSSMDSTNVNDLVSQLESMSNSLQKLNDSLSSLAPKMNSSDVDIFNFDETKEDANEALDAYYNNKITTEEFVSEITDIMDEYSFESDSKLAFTLDISVVERDLDSIKNNPASSSNDIRNYIVSHLYDASCDDDEDEELLDEDDDMSEDLDDSEEEPEKESKQIKVFNDLLEKLYTRKDEVFSIEYVPFTFSDFKTEFDITSDELEDEKIPSNKFAKCIPESWVESFEYITLATPFIEDSNKFIIGLPIPNLNKNDKIPAHFLIYKNSTGYHTYIIKEENLVHDDGTLCSLSDIFTKEAIDKVTKDSQENDNMSSLQAMVTSQLSGVNATVSQNNTNVNKVLFRLLMSSLGNFNDEVIFKRSANLMVKENNHPLMTLNVLGTLVPSLETRQYGNGFVYVGDIQLNDNEDVKYFLSDFELTPVNGKLEFYVRFGTSEIERNQLPKYKEYIRDRLDFNRDVFQNHIEVQALDNIVYIDF